MTNRWRARNASVAQQHRMNVGAIIEAEMLERAPGASRVGVAPRPGTPKERGARRR